MVDATGRWTSSGQATLEHIGVTLVIALLLGAVATWAVREVRPPSSPPAVIEHMAAPLFGGSSSAGRRAETGRPVVRAPGSRAGEHGLLRDVWEGFLWWGALNVDGQIEAGRGFLEQVGVRVEDLVKDPVTTIDGAVDRLGKPPVAGTADRVGGIVGELGALGSKPFRESFLGISRNVGGLAADWLIARFARGIGGVLSGLLGG